MVSSRISFTPGCRNCHSLGDNRVDIEISGEDFYLCIEVKIDAVEGNEQLRRYLDVARERAGNRPFRIVYLSRNELRKLSTDSEKVVSTTWATFAAAIRSEQSKALYRTEVFRAGFWINF